MKKCVQVVFAYKDFKRVKIFLEGRGSGREAMSMDVLFTQLSSS